MNTQVSNVPSKQTKNSTTASVSKDVLEKIARMMSYEVPQKQIAAVMGVSESRISQIINSQEFEEVFGVIAYEKFEEQETLNQGWDGVETLAIDRVLKYMQVDPDPDFALKAAAVANKANRRGSHRNRPIDPQQAGMRSVVLLNATYVDKLQQNFQIEQREHPEQVDREKRDDSLAPGQLDQLLNVEHSNENRYAQKTLEESIEFDMQAIFNPV